MIKLFSYIRSTDLELSVNDWIQKNSHLTIESITYQIAEQEGENWHFACISYRPPLKEVLHRTDS